MQGPVGRDASGPRAAITVLRAASRWRASTSSTPGHASHHVAYLHEETGDAFVGDTAGVRPAFASRGADAAAGHRPRGWRASIDTIAPGARRRSASPISVVPRWAAARPMRLSLVEPRSARGSRTGGFIAGRRPGSRTRPTRRRRGFEQAAPPTSSRWASSATGARRRDMTATGRSCRGWRPGERAGRQLARDRPERRPQHLRGRGARALLVLPGVSYEGGMEMANAIHFSGRAVVWTGRGAGRAYWEKLRDAGLTMAPLERG